MEDKNMRELTGGELNEVSGGFRDTCIYGVMEKPPAGFGCTKSENKLHDWEKKEMKGSKRHWKCRNCGRDFYLTPTY